MSVTWRKDLAKSKRKIFIVTTRRISQNLSFIRSFNLFVESWFCVCVYVWLDLCARWKRWELAVGCDGWIGGFCYAVSFLNVHNGWLYMVFVLCVHGFADCHKMSIVSAVYLRLGGSFSSRNINYIFYIHVFDLGLPHVNCAQNLLKSGFVSSLRTSLSLFVLLSSKCKCWYKKLALFCCP